MPKLGISMAPSARYKGQSGVYDSLMVGDQLTDRKIEKYIKKGWYGRERKENIEKNKQSSSSGMSKRKQKDIVRWLLS